MNKLTNLFVAVPTYDGETFLEKTLESLKLQTYHGVEIHVFDNGPIGNQLEIVNRFEGVIYHKNEKNLGACLNFRNSLQFFLSDTSAEYFMWAQSDDMWSNEYAASLMTSQNFKVSLSEMMSIDSFGQKIRSYPSYRRFFSENIYLNAFTYLFENEYLGKCNMFMSIYSREFSQRIQNHCSFKYNNFDNEIGFLIALEKNKQLCEKVLYHKRYDRACDVEGKPDPMIESIGFHRGFGIIEQLYLFKQYLKVSETRLLSLLIFGVFLIRCPAFIIRTFTKIISKHVIRNRVISEKEEVKRETRRL